MAASWRTAALLGSLGVLLYELLHSVAVAVGRWRPTRNSLPPLTVVEPHTILSTMNIHAVHSEPNECVLRSLHLHT